MNISNGDWASFFLFVCFFTNKQYSLKTNILPSTTASCYHCQPVWPPSHPQVRARCRSDWAQRTTQNPKIKPCFWFWRWKWNSHLLYIHPTTTKKGWLTHSTLSPHWMKRLNERLCLQRRRESQTVATTSLPLETVSVVARCLMLCVCAVSLHARLVLSSWHCFPDWLVLFWVFIKPRLHSQNKSVLVLASAVSLFRMMYLTPNKSSNNNS